MIALRSVDRAGVKGRNPIVDVVERWGVPLRKRGRAYVGYCPFHHDRHHANFHVYPDSGSWCCYVCPPLRPNARCLGGDIFDFVMLREGIPPGEFYRAAERIDAGAVVIGAPQPVEPRTVDAAPAGIRDPAGRACLALAQRVYARALTGQLRAVDYCLGRGLTRETITRRGIGFATGTDLLPALLAAGCDPAIATRVGLLDARGRETFSGRVIIPEWRGTGQGPIWLVARLPHALPAKSPRRRYLGLGGHASPVYGWDRVAGRRWAILVEGIFDQVLLAQWGYPALALMGTGVRARTIEGLRRHFERLYLALDGDEAGRMASADLLGRLGTIATLVPPVAGAKDVGDLGPLRDGARRFRFALAQAWQRSRPALVARSRPRGGWCGELPGSESGSKRRVLASDFDLVGGTGCKR